MRSIHFARYNDSALDSASWRNLPVIATGDDGSANARTDTKAIKRAGSLKR